MVICPLCEHPVAAGDVCDNCGKQLSGPGVAPLPVERLPGLEPTLLPAERAVPAERLADLDPTRFDAAEADAAGLPDLEPTLAAAGPEAPVAALPDLEPTEVEGLPADAATELEAVVCRYCRTAARPGEASCARCGMRLPVAFAPPAAAEGEGAPARCFSCGTLSTGDLCSGCGALLRRG
jgi:hypothetical protein